MKNIRNLLKLMSIKINVKCDKKVGMYYYKQANKKVFINQSSQFRSANSTSWLCENLYYYYYLPSRSDTVVDMGAGFGEEAVYLYTKSPNIRYIGIEIQPRVYEALCNTLNDLDANFKASPFAIAKNGPFYISSNYSYKGISNASNSGYIEIPVIGWQEFLDRYNIEFIDLLKMNIEGAEKEFFSSGFDFSIVRRFIISCHDFRANNNEGDHFRTREKVEKILKLNHYDIKYFSFGVAWADDWIYAEHVESKHLG